MAAKTLIQTGYYAGFFLASALNGPASSGRSSANARLAAKNPIFEPQSYVRPSNLTP